MTNLAYQDIQGGSVHIYTGHPSKPRFDRINLALKELEHVGRIKIFLYKKGKLRLIKTKRQF